MGAHARFSPSAANRLIHCPPSLVLGEAFQEEESPYAAEGSAGHALAEHLIKKHLKQQTRRPVSDYYSDDLLEAVDDYVSFVVGEIESARKECPDPIFSVEQRVDVSDYVPDCFGTMIGEGGSTLSGGEKQRISIARAILKNAPVVLLDEATSSLDPEKEAQIQQAISRLVQGRTVVVIAHRLKTVVGADAILVLDQGRIVEQGTHEQLLTQNGLYTKLWNLQTSTEGWKIN